MNLRERKKLAVWRAVRAAALELFEKQGYAATTIEQIAAAADVSRATFFNYFASKEDVLFDQDPEERENWQALMAARPADEPLWDSLSAIMIGFSESLRERMPIQRKLKAVTPALAERTNAFGQQFRSDLTEWAARRTAGTADDLTVALRLNLLFAAAGTAYQTWRDDESFDDYLDRLTRCLAAAAPTS